MRKVDPRMSSHQSSRRFKLDNKRLIEASRKGNLTKVKQLIENGADIHAKDDQALRLSAFNGHLDVVKYLVENGADVHASDNAYYIALHISALRGHLNVVKYLVENGTNINTRNITHNNVLHISVKYRHLEIVESLVENGSDIHSDYEYSLRKSVHYGYFEIVKYLIENGADQKILFENYINKTWNDKQIAELFLGDKYGNPELRATDELCSESFELPKKGDWYVLWKDNSITIFQNVHLASVESELIKGMFIQC